MIWFDVSQLHNNINKAWLLPEQVLEGQFLQDHVSTDVSPHNQGVFVKGTNKEFQYIS